MKWIHLTDRTLSGMYVRYSISIYNDSSARKPISRVEMYRLRACTVREDALCSRRPSDLHMGNKDAELKAATATSSTAMEERSKKPYTQGIASSAQVQSASSRIAATVASTLLTRIGGALLAQQRRPPSRC